MKKTLLLVCSIMLCMMTTAQTVSKVEPLSWWTDMKCPLTLMFYGEDLQDAEISVQKYVGKKRINTQGLVVKGKHNAESPNYLFVDVEANEPGDYLFTLQKGKKRTSIKYTIQTRRPDSANRVSFSTKDVIYLLMPDRFVDGDTTNNNIPTVIEATDKENIHGRYGGDIQGIINSLDYIKDLGATMIWCTPLLLDNEESWSYHGYACADYYHIDPRFGSNELYKQLVANAHQKGLGMIMDIVTNHCGLAHWWIKDLPYKNWIHQYTTYTQTNNVFTTHYDINASLYDLNLHQTGWFDTHMPDMNLDNPDLLQYFKQWAIWWIEYADLDGLRVDTYPYNEKIPMSDWCKTIREEYPNINIVGECWTRPASNVAYWQADAHNADGFNSNLPSVMDFPTEEAIRQALENRGDGWGEGLTRVYEAISQDYLYADVNNLLVFIGNHDMDHIADIVLNNDLRRVKLAVTMAATMRGILQLYTGDEYGQRSKDMSMGHSGLRQPLVPESKLTQEQVELLNYHRQLLQFRNNEPILHNGKTLHFIGRDNTYAYFRYTEEGAIFVFVNASEQERAIPWSHYSEILTRYNTIGEEVFAHNSVNTQDEYLVEPLSSLVLKINKK